MNPSNAIRTLKRTKADGPLTVHEGYACGNGHFHVGAQSLLLPGNSMTIRPEPGVEITIRVTKA